MTARPTILPAWRIDPNLSAQVSLSDVSTSIMGFRLNLAQDVKPMLDSAVNENVSELQATLRSDPFLETAARREWSRMCRAVALGAAAAGMPKLWLEIRPTRAFAAQPRTDAAALTLTLGVEAETRDRAGRDQAGLPVPGTARHRPQLEQGRVNFAVPIDMPFTEINRLLEAQLKGKTFPEDKSGAFAVNGPRRQRGGFRRPAADLAPRQRQRDQELVRPRRRGDRASLGPVRCWTTPVRSCG